MKIKETVELTTDLDRSEDEQELSTLMWQALQGDSSSYHTLLRGVRDLMSPYVANSLTKFGLAAHGGQEDVLQDILLAIHNKRKTFDPTRHFLPWMYAIARYKTIDYLRRNKVAFQTISIEESLEEFEITASLESGTALDLQALCSLLSAKQRDLLLLVKVEGLSINEAALKMGFTPGDVKVTIHRAIKELRKLVRNGNREN